MPEIEITDDQREYLEDLRGELEEDVVYGHVRLTDALQFLIDSREGAAADLDAADSGEENAENADPEPGDEADAPVDDEESDAEADAEDTDEDAEDAEDAEDEGADAEDAEDEGADAEDAEDEGADADDAEDEGADADDTEDAEPAAAPTPGGGGDRLNTMMQLLDTHEEKWREGSGDARYEVDLPDGSTETANTKDDVRALLFKNY